MIEDKAFEDFEPETSKDDEQYLRETLYKLIDYYHLNQTKMSNLNAIPCFDKRGMLFNYNYICYNCLK